MRTTQKELDLARRFLQCECAAQTLNSKPKTTQNVIICTAQKELNLVRYLLKCECAAQILTLHPKPHRIVSALWDGYD